MVGNILFNDSFNELSAMHVNGEGNLVYPHEAQANLTYEQKDAYDVLLIGVLSVHVPERVWMLRSFSVSY